MSLRTVCCVALNARDIVVKKPDDDSPQKILNARLGPGRALRGEDRRLREGDEGSVLAGGKDLGRDREEGGKELGDLQIFVLAKLLARAPRVREASLLVREGSLLVRASSLSKIW